MLRGSPVGDDVDRGSINEIIAVFSRFLLKRVHEDLKISVRDLPDDLTRVPRSRNRGKRGGASSRAYCVRAADLARAHRHDAIVALSRSPA